MAFIRKPWAEPYKIKVVEPLKMTTRDYRLEKIKEAGYNTFLLRSEEMFKSIIATNM